MPGTQKKICIIGTGGSGKDTLCCLMDIHASTGQKTEDEVCFMVDDVYYNEPEVLGIKVIRRSEFDPLLYNVVVAVGDSQTRRRIIESLPKETTYTSIIHPSVIMSKWVEIGEGSIIGAGTILTCNIKIGKHAQLNLQTTICHDCTIGDFFTTAPAVNINGNCTIGDGVYLGSNSCVREKISICNNVTVGMGSVVVKNILQEGVYLGNPSKRHS